jgi:hypothetical protein
MGSTWFVTSNPTIANEALSTSLIHRDPLRIVRSDRNQYLSSAGSLILWILGGPLSSKLSI